MKPESSSLIRGSNSGIPWEQPLLQTPTNLRRRVKKLKESAWVVHGEKERGMEEDKEFVRDGEDEKTYQQKTASMHWRTEYNRHIKSLYLFVSLLFNYY